MRIDSFKKFLQILLRQKSIKVFADGHIIITYRYKPDALKISQKQVTQLENKLLDKLNVITNIKYRITKVQKEPSLCYNTYVKVISSSSASSQDKIKSFLKYFRKDISGNFIKTSYKEITINLVPSSKEDFVNFLLKA